MALLGSVMRLFGLGKTETEKLVLKKVDSALADYIKENGFVLPDIADYLSKNRERLNVTWKRYKEIKNQRVADSMPLAFRNTDKTWYNVEKGGSGFEVLAVPSECVRSHLVSFVEESFQKNDIEFRQIDNINARKLVIRATAIEAVRTEFKAVVKGLIEKKSTFVIPNWRKAHVVEEVRNDIYHFDGKVDRKDMLIIDSDKQSWPKMKAARPVDRNFSDRQATAWRYGPEQGS